MAFSLVGHRLEHFELLEPLGAGAMSEVYLGRDLRLQKDVAVKVISEALARRPDLVERFEREARAAARLHHPNVATVFFSGNYEAKPFYAMELIKGWSLGEIIEHRIAFTWDQAMGLFAQAAMGLQAAIEAGITHRDIKPGNLMVTEVGQLKIVDFGLAKLGDDHSLTRSGAMMGTPYYIAPEVVRGEGADARSDLYSLGVTFFHVLSGRPPFDAETPYGVMMRHVQERVPLLHEVNRQFPESVSQLVAQMMAKDAAERPADFKAVAAALQACAAAMPASLRSQALQWCAFDKVHAGSEAGRCTLCRKPRAAAEVPEVFHVDLVTWNRNDARENVAKYVAKAVGQQPEDIDALLEPLPFRAAFRIPRERAKRMQRAFFDLGADVSLVPADLEVRGQEVSELPFPPAWPVSLPAPPPAADRGSLAWSRSGAAIGGLGLLVVILAVALAMEHRQPVSGAAGTPTAAGTPNTVQTPLPVLAAAPGAAAEAAGTEDGLAPVEPLPIESEGETGDDRDVAAATPGAVAEASEAPPPPANTVELPGFHVDGERVANPALTRSVADAFASAGAQVGAALGQLPNHNVVLQPGLGTPEDWERAPVRPRIELAVGGPPADPEAMALPAIGVLVRAELARRGGGNAPAWLTAGCVLVLQKGAMPAVEWPAVVAEGSHPIELTMMALTRSPTSQRTLHAFVSWLTARDGGWGAVDAFLVALSEGQDVDAASLAAFGLNTEQLESQWIADSGAIE